MSYYQRSIYIGTFDDVSIVPDDTKLVVEVEDNAFVCIDITSRAKVEITASGTAKVTVFQHGGECINRASGNANIKVIDKR